MLFDIYTSLALVTVCVLFDIDITVAVHVLFDIDITSSTCVV